MGLDQYMLRNKEIVHTWRKFNALHKWFVDRVGGDNEPSKPVTKEQIVEIKDILKEVRDLGIEAAKKKAWKFKEEKVELQWIPKDRTPEQYALMDIPGEITDIIWEWPDEDKPWTQDKWGSLYLPAQSKYGRKIMKLLPPQSGFFFGDTGLTGWYFNDVIRSYYYFLEVLDTWNDKDVWQYDSWW